MAGIKKKRSYFFSGVVGPLGKLFRTGNRPDQQAFENLTASSAFFDEPEDRARLDSVPALKDKQGLVVLATDTQAKANEGQKADRSLVVQPHQLPTADDEAQIINDYNGGVADTAVEVTVDGAVTTRNKFIVRFKANFITFLNTLVDGGTKLAGAGVDLFKQKTGRKLEFRKIVGAGAASVSINGNDEVEVDVPVTSDELVKVSNADTTAGFLENKLVAGTDIALDKLNPGANEQIRVRFSGTTGRYKTASATNVIPVIGGTPTFTVAANLDYTPYVPVIIQDLNLPNNKVYGKVISYVGTSLQVYIAQTLGTTAASTNWEINIGSPIGLDADTLIHAQSNTGPYDIVTSFGQSRTFNITYANLSYQGSALTEGMRIRATQNGTDNWMEGVCTASLPTQVTLRIDRISGTGNISAWELTIADGYALEDWREVGNDGGNTTYLNAWAAGGGGIFYRKDYNTKTVTVRAASNGFDGSASTSALVFTFVETAYHAITDTYHFFRSPLAGNLLVSMLGGSLTVTKITDFDPFTTSGVNVGPGVEFEFSYTTA